MLGFFEKNKQKSHDTDKMEGLAEVYTRLSALESRCRAIEIDMAMLCNKVLRKIQKHNSEAEAEIPENEVVAGATWRRTKNGTI